MVFPSKDTVDRIRTEYPKGTRIELVWMSEPYTKLTPGDLGTVTLVDDTGTVHVAWDKGSSLGVIYGEDAIKRIP